MLYIVVPLLIVAIVAIFVYYRSSGYMRGENLFFTILMGGFVTFLIAFFGNAMAMEYDGNYTARTTEYRLDELGSDKFAILADENYTFRTEDDVLIVPLDQVSIEKGGEAEVLVTTYDNKSWLTLFGKSNHYHLVLPDGSLDF